MPYFPKPATDDLYDIIDVSRSREGGDMTASNGTYLYGSGNWIDMFLFSGAFNAVVTDDDGSYFGIETGVAPATVMAVTAPYTTPLHRGDQNLKFTAKFRLLQLTDERVFVGLTDQDTSTVVATDNPAGSRIGLSFSTPRGDTNWMISLKDGTTENLINTGVPADTETTVLVIEFKETGVARIKLYGPDKNLLFSVVTSTNAPAITTALRFIGAIQTQAAANKILGIYVARLIAKA